MSNSHPFFAHERPLLIAHRGWSGRYPENTMLAFDEALKAGADVIELDIHLTKDSHLIVSHDRTGVRTTNLKSEEGVKPMTWDLLSHEEVKALDAAYHFSPDEDGAYPYRGAGIKIPSLREVLETFPEARINIDMKDHREVVADALLSLIHEYEAHHRVIVCSFSHDLVAKVRQTNSQHMTSLMPSLDQNLASPSPKCSLLTGGTLRETVLHYISGKVWMDRFYASEGDVLEVPSHSFLNQFFSSWMCPWLDNPTLIGGAKERGQKVFVFVLNTEAEIINAVDAGVDGIMTDNVELAARVFRSLGLLT